MGRGKSFSWIRFVAISLVGFLHLHLTRIRLNFEELACLVCAYTVRIAMAWIVRR